ncbi:MAG: OsmC family protein [Ferruginibacter sp.]|nr:OsmC family protein [Ferruginibacter sp.]
MEKLHQYAVTVAWTGNTGSGTKEYRSYERSHLISVDQKVNILGSSDAAFRGDKSMHTPEDLFVASISTCHMLWYLHLCSEAGVVVTKYIDQATATMTEEAGGAGQFTEVVLHPQVSVADSSMILLAEEQHQKANAMCFIARSLNFPVKHAATVVAE